MRNLWRSCGELPLRHLGAVAPRWPARLAGRHGSQLADLRPLTASIAIPMIVQAPRAMAVIRGHRRRGVRFLIAIPPSSICGLDGCFLAVIAAV